MLKKLSAIAACVAACPGWSGAESVELSKEKYLDKCRGAWAGQMIGVCYGAPYEFRSNGKPITDDVQAWSPERVEGAIQQDDCYVEMTFLQALEEHGIEITPAQAGAAFGASQYELWHANRVGRDNVRAGIMPPLSGHPDYNKHADDIDFQIEADLFGILTPGLPLESNKLCDVFGHIMNYGDGVYGGMFVAGMYAAAYFEDKDVNKVLEAGLACIPDQSEYENCIRDVMAWHKDHPQDWLAAWQKIEDKWQDDVDCAPGDPFNIDAKINGAYIVMGLLYGEGDFLKTMDISMRCGQDADCNPSNAVGVLGCMYGYSGIPAEFTSGIDKMKDTNFAFTSYSFETLIPACQRVTEQLVERAGGEVHDDSFVIPVQAPTSPATFEQWVDQSSVLSSPISDKDMLKWAPGWGVRACGRDMEPGYYAELKGREHVLLLHPKAKDDPAIIVGDYDFPDQEKLTLRLPVASYDKGNFRLLVKIADEVLLDEEVDTKGEWRELDWDISKYAGTRETRVRVEVHATGWQWEAAYLGRPVVE